MKKFALLSILAALSFLGCTNNQSQELRVYSIIHDEETEALTKLFTDKTGIPVSYLRATTGELVNRVITEKNDPQADILLGGASSYHIQADKEGALESYTSPLAKNLPSYAVASDNTWTGFCVLTLGIGVNTKRFAEKFPNIPLPKTWEDLLNPAFKGEIILNNPSASSTGYIFVQNQLQRLGEEKGWEYLLALTKNVGQFPDSGSAPAKLLGTGEYALGVSYLHALAKYNAQGFNVQPIAPPQSAGDVDCVSIMKNSKNLSAAKKFVDFMLSIEAQELMSEFTFTAPVNPEAKAIKGSISVSDIDLIDYDVQKAASEKAKVLYTWAKDVK
ncbi:extracellular solute-binding protein [Treponema ruminis]|uniref:Iron(III) transport system substrate-binding protein n=1 Tax=Treponema ruminis TaxID=744515 RepID=A0A7W8GAX1_9SPIR|nr:ABC transporter substrate-binding protein [Treponema ruminis]MBB5226992.1 iron(III) transport system substrate-binding protein [Treponema ruminis]QSI01419.1 extracellular solute-binding protein [Treponema ruminis]